MCFWLFLEEKTEVVMAKDLNDIIDWQTVQEYILKIDVYGNCTILTVEI